MSEQPLHDRAERADVWRSRSAAFVSGLLLFETLSGLAITFLPFSLTAQFIVVTHTVGGLLFLLPYLVYQLQHWQMYRTASRTHVKVTGYGSLLSTVVCSASGVVLTWQAAFATRISYTWDIIHLVSTFALIAFVLPHIIVLISRSRRTSDREPALVAAVSSYNRAAALWVIGFAALTGVCVLVYSPVVFQNTFPADYEYAYGDDRPFAPSLATTSTGGAFDPASLAGSESCGTSGCHEEILQEWLPSAHRYAALDAAFQAVQKVMADQNGAESTRYCGGCHDPISLFSGTKNIFVEDLTSQAGYQEGISCLACHAIRETDVKGNANYMIAQPERYAFELKEGEGAKFASDFLIRAYPWQHVESLTHRMFKSAEFCAACHKQFIDQEINRVGWVQLQNQYDNWRKSRWNHEGDPTKTIECRECHMPLAQNSTDPASGDELDYNRSPDDGKHRSHRFLGANQFIPLVHDLPGAKEHVALVEEWLRGDLEIPEIADKWTQGEAVPIELVVPDVVADDDTVSVRVVITSNKVGHDFPTGPLDIIQCWVEITVTDDDGNEVFTSGARDDRHFIEPGSFIFKAEAVDQYGNLIDRHNLWEMVGVRFKRSLFPGFSDVAQFEFPCATTFPPTDSLREESFAFASPSADRDRRLTVHAKLLYRKVDQFLLNYLMGEDSGITAPITTIAERTKEIVVKRSGLGAMGQRDPIPAAAAVSKTGTE